MTANAMPLGKCLNRKEFGCSISGDQLVNDDMLNNNRQ